MIKKIAFLIVLFLAAYLGAHFYIRESKKIKTDTAILTRLLDCEPNNVKRIKLYNSQGHEIAFDRVDDLVNGMPSTAQFGMAEWDISMPDMGEGDTQAINRVASTTCESFNPVPINKSSWKGKASNEGITSYIELGFIKDEHEKRARLSFGESYPDKTVDIELKVDEREPEYFRISSKLFNLINEEEKNWKNFKITRMPNDSIQVVSVFLKNQEKFTLEREGISWRKKIGSIDKGLVSEEANKYVNRISTLRALDIKNPNLGKANCESKAKDFKIIFRGLNNNSEIIVINKSKNHLFACSSARDSEFIVHGDMLKYLPTSIK